ncbi:DUF4442 domain-containing protein [Neptunomonas sp.]|uniref:DUF4442 domain-containing protein n=1 Tax=Neptunomonas sp. TaxID=1971898 RepID=UPI00356B3A4C
MKWSPRVLKFALNIYGPYLGAGIRITHIDPEWREMHVRMKLRWYNRNIMGTHFGGSLYAMVDPQMMLMLMNRLGKEYIVWDQAAEIEYVKPAKGTVEAHLSLSDAQLDEIKRKTSGGVAYRPSFEIAIRDLDGIVVSKVKKVLYVKRKKR